MLALARETESPVCCMRERQKHTCIASLVSLACSTDFSFLWLVSGAGLSLTGSGTWLSSGRAWLAPWLLPDAGRVTSSSPVWTDPYIWGLIVAKAGRTLFFGKDLFMYSLWCAFDFALWYRHFLSVIFFLRNWLGRWLNCYNRSLWWCCQNRSSLHGSVVARENHFLQSGTARAMSR